MDWAALILWVLTAGGGFVLLAIWLKAGGMNQRSSGRIRPAVILTHFALAATGLVLWIVYVAGDSSTIAWIAFALLLVVALIGFGMLGMWLAQRSKRDGEAAEQRFPVAIVGLHGLLAATTLVLVFLAAAGIGS
jgi:nitrogen fixation/metabolism regulation signal transduction histidine kinase